LVLHRARCAAHVHRDVRGARVGNDSQHRRIGRSSRHVVDQHRAGGERGASDIRLRRVDTHHNSAVARQRFDDRDDPAQLFGRVDRLRARARRFTADVEDRRARAGERQAVFDRV
jgi:hypothetical protein